MTKDKYAIPSPLRPSRMEWGYDNKQRDPGRRVSVVPDGMLLDAIYLTLEEKGLLLSIFCRYWTDDEPVHAENLRLEHRLSKQAFDKIVDSLVGWSAVRRAKDKLIPLGSFGQAPSTGATIPNRSLRNMPPDWQELREAVFERDGYACVYCGSGRDLHCDHVDPVVRGGGHNIENLVTSCATCNLSKSSKTVAEWRPDIAELMKR